MRDPASGLRQTKARSERPQVYRPVCRARHADRARLAALTGLTIDTFQPRPFARVAVSSGRRARPLEINCIPPRREISVGLTSAPVRGGSSAG